MHEMAIAQGILDIVQQHVPPAQVPEVAAVRVRVGSLSGVVAESLAFCFEALATETPLARARLDIERVPARCACGDCGQRFAPEAMVFLCPACGGGRTHPESGGDLQVVHVVLDGQDAPKQSGAMRPRA
jgi:hydrogenase nickel incorporation protein HypA/HybF